ncbi:hypothetical protein [Sulfuriferula sp. AH1]|uniref:hypothetical protein n=1 Tax=Sulfuriferula sp. AH1 TaxID=1985873 RepID=UPI001CB98182|nr:hypothetical protein [Sulfuriferula sp. AH1]
MNIIDWQFWIEFLLVILFSLLIPGGIYAVMLVKHSISRMTVLLLGLTLIAVAGIDAVLLHHLANEAAHTRAIWDDRLLTSELSMALYLLPLVTAGIGINIVSHLLIRHLTEAERNFYRDHEDEEK